MSIYIRKKIFIVIFHPKKKKKNPIQDGEKNNNLLKWFTNTGISTSISVALVFRVIHMPE